VSGLVDGSDHLKLTMNDEFGTVIDAGNVRGPQGLPGVNALDNDAAVAAYVATTGSSATKTALEQRYARVWSPETYGAAADGSTDDTTAIQNTIVAAAGRPIRFAKGKTYKVTSTLTFTGDVDLNGSTINSTNSVNVAGHFRNGKVTGPGSVIATGQSNVIIEKIEVAATAVTSQGIYLNQCTDIIVRNCKVSGGPFRGILLARCDRFTISDNYVKDVTDNAGYGILVTSATGEVHGDGNIVNNVLDNCAYGIAANGGEANPAQPGYTGQYTLRGIRISSNKVYMLSYSQHSGIWATCNRHLDVSGNYINGSVDTGVDFEYCTQSQAIGNIIVDVTAGALSAIFGCSDILFEGNRIEFGRTLAGSAATSGITWKNTSWTAILLRNNPTRISIIGNTFRSSNGTLGQIQLGGQASNIVIAQNVLRNVYMAGNNSTPNNVVRMNILDNVFTYDLNLNNPAIYHECVTEFYCERNHITLIGGEVMESSVRHYITVYDASANSSNLVHFIGNVINNSATGTAMGLALITTSTTIKAFIIGNIADKFGVAALTYTGITFDKNYKQSSVGILAATRNDNATAVALPAVT